jgi:antibiotic biosynthesis monooxygenase (ABM) superfamily enzyme
MGKINLGRVLLGGLLAGVVLTVLEFVLNGLILGDRWTAAMESLNRTAPEGAGVMIAYVVWNFVLGIALVWFYAAVRPRFGPGPKTAVITGLAVWFVVWLLGFGITAIVGLFPTNLVVITVIWELFEVPIATVAGAWLYQEGAPVAAVPRM